jgi:hypothetical protein
MSCIITTVLRERFPQGLPDWCTPFLKGIQQLGIKDLEEAGADDVNEEEETGADDRSDRSSSTSSLSAVSTMDDTIEEEPDSGAEQESVLEKEPAVQEGEHTAEANFRNVSVDRRRD